MSHLPYPPALTSRASFRQINPVTHRCVYHHVKNGSSQWVPLRYTLETFKIHPLVSPHVIHHAKPVPVFAKDAAGQRSHVVPLQDIQAYIPIQGFINLVQVQKYRAQDFFPHGRL